MATSVVSIISASSLVQVDLILYTTERVTIVPCSFEDLERVGLTKYETHTLILSTHPTFARSGHPNEYQSVTYCGVPLSPLWLRPRLLQGRNDSFDPPSHKAASFLKAIYSRDLILSAKKVQRPFILLLPR